MRNLVFQIGCILALLLSPQPSLADKEVPFQLPNARDLRKLRTGIIYTTRGDIYFELYPEDSPYHVANFKYLADKGFYRNLRFHLYRPGYIIQGGSPSRNPNAGPGYTLPPEFSAHKHQAGVIGMARKPDEMNRRRRSNGSQFHILLGNAPQMDGSFTIFGKVIDGMEIVDELRKGDRIEDVKVFVREY